MGENCAFKQTVSTVVPLSLLVYTYTCKWMNVMRLESLGKLCFQNDLLGIIKRDDKGLMNFSTVSSGFKLFLWVSAEKNFEILVIKLYSLRRWIDFRKPTGIAWSLSRFGLFKCRSEWVAERPAFPAVYALDACGPPGNRNVVAFVRRGERTIGAYCYICAFGDIHYFRRRFVVYARAKNHTGNLLLFGDD